MNVIPSIPFSVKGATLAHQVKEFSPPASGNSEIRVGSYKVLNRQSQKPALQMSFTLNSLSAKLSKGDYCGKNT